MFNKSVVIIIMQLLLLGADHSIIAQSNQYYESPKAMIYRLQQETDEMQAKIAENPSSPDAERLKIMIQLNNRRIKEIFPGATEQAIRSIRPHGRRLEDYMVIAQNNLFTPLGAVAEVKQQQFIVTGILVMGTRKVAFIQSTEGNSYYVAEGDTFGNGVKVASIMADRVTIINGGNRIELKLGEGSSSERPQPENSGGIAFSKKPSQIVEKRNK